MVRSQESVGQTPAWAQDNKAEIEAMKTFRNALIDRDTVALAQSKDEVFHEILADAERRGYIHYTRLAAAMGLKDASSVSRWFNGKVAPDRFRRAFALSALEKVVANDIRRMESEDRLEPIGYKSMKDFPELEVDVPDLVA